jgi:adenine specific DNA methylase Mod
VNYFNYNKERLKTCFLLLKIVNSIQTIFNTQKYINFLALTIMAFKYFYIQKNLNSKRNLHNAIVRGQGHLTL